ncbi:YdeI/OmpD-associated family protein [Knoellia remsis]|nr:YdeI/OmpD-associated family protein [Knoellia remsis]
MAITFDGTVRQIGERLIVELPDAASQELPSRGQVAVEGTFGGKKFETVLEPDGRKGHFIAVSDALPGADGLAASDTVAVDVTPTKAWPEPEVPDDLGAALADAPDLEDTWSDITPMARWEWVRWVGATKNPATRERRVEVSIDKLRNGKRRPCCFDLASCTDPELAKSGKLIEAD